MNAKELLVHNSGEGKTAEGFHAGIVYPFRVLVLALEFEREVISQMPTFMVSSEEEQSVWIPDFERPQVQHALH